MPHLPPPSKEELVILLQSKTKRGLDRLVHTIIKSTLQREKSLKKIYEYFTYLYEYFYPDIVMGTSKISRANIKALECLSMPIYAHSLPFQKLLLGKIQRYLHAVEK
jgi:hypothetical protein